MEKLPLSNSNRRKSAL